jgi:hypothetical protein
MAQSQGVKEWDRTGVVFREDTTPNYWEIGTYLPARIAGAGRIPIGRITRERMARGWRYYVHAQAGIYSAYSRKGAINTAHHFAVNHPSYSWDLPETAFNRVA